MPTEVVKAGYWSSTSGFPVDRIESSHFTHLFCAFADLDCQTYEVAFPAETMPEFSTFTTIVQQRHPDVKTLLSIGGPGSVPSTFASMANQECNRASFIKSSIKLARTYYFHGLDLCWLYPFTKKQSGDLCKLLNEWRDAINAEANNARDFEPLLLTANVFCSPQPYQYPCPEIVRTLDWINVMAYDFHSPSDSPDETRAHAARRSEGADQPSWESGINAWLRATGNRTKKIVLGLPFFGYACSLVDENINNQVYALAKGPSASYSNPTGLMGHKIKNNFIAADRKLDRNRLMYDNQINNFKATDRNPKTCMGENKINNFIATDKKFDSKTSMGENKTNNFIATDKKFDSKTSMGENKINNFIPTDRKFDPNTKTNYCYDDMEAIAKVIEKAKKMELLGYLAWHVATDDNWILSRRAAREWGEL